jgi:hypothetical protein
VIGEKNMDDIDRLDQVIGQLAALNTFCIAVVATHPDPQALRKCLLTLSEVTIAKTLGGAASDQMLAGVEIVLSDLRSAADKRLARGE